MENFPMLRKCFLFTIIRILNEIEENLTMRKMR